MRRFIIPDGTLLPSCGTVTLTGDTYHHMIRVLRMGVGTPLTLMDRQRRRAHGVIDHIDAGSVSIRLTDAPDSPEEGLSVTLCQAMPKGDKLDLIIQKGVEVGVERFVLFPSSRSIAQIPPERRAGRLTRLERIAMEAARQSGGCPATIIMVDTFREMLRLCGEGLKLLAWEGERERRFRDLHVGIPPRAVTLLVGPEGGFTDGEAHEALLSGFTPVSLGPRVLRTETAGIVLAALTGFRWGDLG